ncbi:histidine kinase [Salipiger aestuarii]|uniref:Response regulator receiver domain-containing protein n=1 Tax=Salipiger aestuarii TaxID=568098 RepID=A0A327XTM5_9RHOB|nr:response regulator [Salipiger aestuarii]KAA8605723.1 histidine kinase [Salipiger aestuarii]KAA8607362.1 histidine kinase [Salipiger aestuarii]KAB2539871.1 histidine kinase [Salipiger aestuarii]RAK11306.1 response regulator receiver domain-containing protein [Salipiger aestuarii]
MPLKTKYERGRKARVMLCEDEFIVALDMQMMLEDFGYDVEGPFPSLRSAFTALDGDVPDVALLDVNLRDGEVFPLADRLARLGVRLVFHSGHVNDDEIAQRYPDAECCQKPTSDRSLRAALGRQVEARCS